MNIESLIIVLMAIGLVVFVSDPLVRRSSAYPSASETHPEVERLLLQKETLYTAIRDLDFDFQTSKVDAKDYAALRHHLEDDALQVLRRLDTVDPLAILDHELESQILALRQQQTGEVALSSQAVCPDCGGRLLGGENFCPSCGRALFPS